MRSRRNFSGPKFGLCLLAFAVGLSNVAVAQSGDAAGSNASGSGNGATPPAPASSAAAPSETSAAPAAPAPTPPAATTTAAAPAAGTLAATAPTAAVQPGAHAEVEPTPAGGTPIVVENLPGSGYPEPRIRGLVGGSLWFVMPGLQFPYMAQETSPNQVRVAISGYVWNDTSYSRLVSGKTTTTVSSKRWYNQGVGLVRITPSYTTRDGWFAQGNVETVANIEQTVAQNGSIGTVYDMWARAGKWNLFDVTVGRFQGWEVYHYGMGLDYNTLERTGANLQNLPAPRIYGLDTYWDRPSFGAGNYAAHYYPTDYLRFEVLGQIGSTNTGANTRGVRPVAILDFGFVKVKAGWEYGVTHAQADNDESHTRNNGFGGAVQFVWNPYLEGGINGAIGYVDSWTNKDLPNPGASTTTKTYGGFLNGRIYGPLMLGVGANQTHYNTLQPNANPLTPSLNGQTDNASHFQGFAAVQYSFWDKLLFKFVANYASAHYPDILENPPHAYTNKEYGGRFRTMYLF